MKEYYGNNMNVDGDILSRHDDHDYIEQSRSEEPDYDAYLRGYAQRVAASRKEAAERKNLQSEVKTLAATESEEELPYDTGSLPLHPKVHSLLVDAAHAEDELRKKGYSSRGIARKVGKPLMISMIRLGINGIDTSGALGSSQHDVEDNLRDLDEQRRQDKIDKMVDQGMSYDEARRRA